jgi:hypothetical protein|tara:strand:- start:1393 stop:1692 length:300 start_codon:yes stop_codon:yes gene_type:complete
MKGLHDIILTHFKTHQTAKWSDPKARDMLAKLLVKRIEDHLISLDWKIEAGHPKYESTTADEYNEEYLNELYGLGTGKDVANQYGDDDYPTNLLDDESV